MPRPRRRAFALAGGAILLFAVGTSVQAGWLLVLASCLLGVTVAGFVLPGRMVAGVGLERRAPAEAFQGQEVRVALIVSNGSRGARLALDLRDEHLGTVRAFLPRLAPGDRAIVQTTRSAARRGVHEASDVVVASSAPFGVAERRRRIAVPSATVVYPRLVRLGELDFLESSPTPERAIHSAPRRGTGPDYLGIREYRVGDSMRHVHWPSTARHGVVMVREFEREQTRRLVVVIDSVADLGAEGPTPLDRCCSVAASVAFAAHGAGQGVRLVSAVGGEPFSMSRAEPASTLRWLAELRPGGGLSMGALVDRLGEEVLGAATLLLVMPTWRANDPRSVAEAIGDLVVRAPRVAVVLVEVHTFENARRVPHLDPRRVGELEDALRAAGVLVFRLSAADDLAEALGRSPAEVIS
ncbi:MAG: DUF58 domain-containing protein [Actinomycetota bacterium]